MSAQMAGWLFAPFF